MQAENEKLKYQLYLAEQAVAQNASVQTVSDDHSIQAEGAAGLDSLRACDATSEKVEAMVQEANLNLERLVGVWAVGLVSC